MIKEYEIEERFRRQVGHGSLGMTSKFFKDGYWYKQDCAGYEGKSERLCSMLLECSSIKNYVKYEECIINGKSGCRSKNFLNEDETLVTLSRLYDYSYGGNLKNKVNSYAKLEDRIQYVLDFVYEGTGLDLYEYLGKILKFDMFTYDVDRHFNNLAVIKTKNGYKEAPLFDFGGSFFSMRHIFTEDMTLEEKIKKMTPQPFSTTFEEQAEYFSDINIHFEFEKIRDYIKAETLDIQEMIHHNIERYEKFFDIKKCLTNNVHQKEKEQEFGF